uniref:MFS transporter n=2 Tax=Enterocloster clostridioformis TaxID=1531 RepID=UPI0025A51DB6|nr:glycoside-pentoside-hexuronide (GPH):cation symporter [Enterocloster clostridioformis]
MTKQQMRTLENVKPFGMRDQMGYLAGNFAGDFTYTLCTGFMMKFYTDVLGVSAGIVGIAMMVAQVLDAVTDLGMGQICDRSPTTEQGKFRPWIRRIAGPVSLISFLMYASWIRNAAMGLKIAWLFVTYLLYSSVFYTMIIIPYGSMASAMSNDALDRTKLSNWRHIGGTLAVTVINFIVPLVVYVDVTNGDGTKTQIFDGTRMMLCGLVFSVLSFVLWMACYFMTTERVKIPSKNEKLNIGSFVNDLLHNRGLIAIVLMIIVQECSNSAFHRMSGYMFDNYFGQGSMQAITSPVETIITLVIAAAIVGIVAKVGKKEITVTGCLISAIVFAIAFIMHTSNVYVWIVIYGGVTVGLALFNPVTFALVTDIVDEEEVRTGNRMDGTIYSVYSFGRKFGSALSTGIAGMMLTMIGYDSAPDKYAPELTNGIYNVACLVPLIGFLLMAVIVGVLHPLNKKKVDANVAILKERHGGQ